MTPDIALVLSSLAVPGLVSPADAVGGFANPAVVTVWAMFIISEGLTRAGIADRIGVQVARVAGRSELRMISIFMLVGGAMSSFMNIIGVAALLMPVAMTVARRGGVAPSRVLMPLAYGTLVGGMMTLIGTPPNLLISDVLREARGQGFGFFDFAWIGLPVLLAATAFMALAGRHLLARTDTTRPAGDEHHLQELYGLQERIAALRLPQRATDRRSARALGRAGPGRGPDRAQPGAGADGGREQGAAGLLALTIGTVLAGWLHISTAAVAGATLIVPTAALVLLMAPIALSAAADLGISPLAPVMAIAIAAAASFASPVAHPANVLVMGPGGYRLADYIRLGLPLTLLVFALAMLLLPLVWPL